MASVAGIRVLLAGNSSYDIAAAQCFLLDQGCSVLTCSSASKTAAILDKEKFDLVVAEAPTRNGAGDDAVDAFALLRRRSCPPVAVVMDSIADQQQVDRVLKAGGVDVLSRPVSDQPRRLATLLQRAAGKSLHRDVHAYVAAYVAESTSTSSCGAAGPTSKDCADCASGEQQSTSGASTGTRAADDGQQQDSITQRQRSPFGEQLTDVVSSSIDLAASLDEAVATGCCYVGEALGPDDDPFMAEDAFVRSSESCFSAEFSIGGSADFSNGGASSAYISGGVSTPPCSVRGSKRDFFDSCGLSCLTGDSLSSQGSEADDRACKKQKVEWTSDLHRRFVDAVETLGPHRAVPSKILEAMGPLATGLTRQNVASHLQKYRSRHQHQQAHLSQSPTASVAHLSPTASGAALSSPTMAAPAAAPAYHHPMVAAGAVLGVPCYPNPPAAAHPQAPSHMSWGVPGGASCYPHPQAAPGWSASAPTTACMIPVTATTMQQPRRSEEEVPEELRCAIADLLRQGQAGQKGKALKPIGLRLDVRSVLDVANKRQARA